MNASQPVVTHPVVIHVASTPEEPLVYDAYFPPKPFIYCCLFYMHEPLCPLNRNPSPLFAIHKLMDGEFYRGNGNRSSKIHTATCVSAGTIRAPCGKSDKRFFHPCQPFASIS